MNASLMGLLVNTSTRLLLFAACCSNGCLVLGPRSPREYVLNKTCLECDPECKPQSGHPTCYGPVSPIPSHLCLTRTVQSQLNVFLLIAVCIDHDSMLSSCCHRPSSLGILNIFRNLHITIDPNLSCL